MRRLLSIPLLVATLALPLWPQVAEGGIVVIVMRETNPSLQLQEPIKDAPENEGDEPEGQPEAYAKEATSDRAAQRSDRSRALVTTKWTVPNQVEAETQPTLNHGENAQGWLDVEDDPGLGAVGCGGAQAARGPAGLLPLALVAAALLLGRARRPC